MKCAVQTCLGLAAGLAVALLLEKLGVVSADARVVVFVLVATYGAGVGWLGFSAPNLSPEEADEWERNRNQD